MNYLVFANTILIRHKIPRAIIKFGQISRGHTEITIKSSCDYARGGERMFALTRSRRSSLEAWLLGNRLL